MANYWDMRAHTPFVIIAQEPQVWNLRVGYAGSADVLLWFLPPDADAGYWQARANHRRVTVEEIGRTGGYTALGDWKTSPEVSYRARGAGHGVPRCRLRWAKW